jgi:hypothetical protein
MPEARSSGTGRVCQRCGTDVGTLERVGRRDTCLRCGSDLHCCRNCRFYAPGHHNDCLETQAERQVDKRAGNFCDYFSFRVGPAGTQSGAPPDARSKLEALFAKKK